MSKDRVIQLLAGLVAVASLGSATLLVPEINRTRRDLQLSFDLQIGDRQPPKYALAAAATGSFRGLAVDALWYRMEMKKAAGKFNEAFTLSQWITTLQPRFPRVWSFQAWNMAYNISVETYTKEERYDWVNKGVKLLREQGIVHNPNATPLYRELSWIFFHKMGKVSDDMHWYYKGQLAKEWHLILGGPTEGLSTKGVIAEFKPVADAMDRYFVLDRITREARDEIDRLAEAVPLFADQLNEVRELSTVRVLDELEELNEKYGRTQPVLIAELEPLEKMMYEQQNRETRDKLDILFEDHPGTQKIVERMLTEGLELNKSTLELYGRLLVTLRYNSLDSYLTYFKQNGSGAEKYLANLVVTQDPAEQEALKQVIAFLRAKVLKNDYNMDPGVMYEIMELFGPVDWRHPAAHGVYWAFLGERMSGELLDKSRIDQINTNRAIIHGIQELMHFGRINYDPYLERVDLLPDPRFIPAYETAMERSLERLQSATYNAKENTIDNYEDGHENFLLKAISYSYLYGEEEQAQKYYDKVRRLYGYKKHNLAENRYVYSLPDFVMNELSFDMDMQNQSNQFIDAMVQKAVRDGLGNGRMDVFSKFLDMARKAYDKFQKGKSIDPKAGTDRARLGLLSFDQMCSRTYISVMRNPNISIIQRINIYHNTPIPLRENTYAMFQEAARGHASRAGYNPDTAFPAPPSFKKKQGPVAPPKDGTGNNTPKSIERM